MLMSWKFTISSSKEFFNYLCSFDPLIKTIIHEKKAELRSRPIFGELPLYETFWHCLTFHPCNLVYLKWFLSRVYQLVPLQFAALHKGFAAFGAHVHARPVCVKVLPHGGVISVTKKLSIIYLTVIFIIYPSFPDSDNPCRDSRELVLNNSPFSLKMRKPGYREYFSNFHQISINEKYDNKRLPKHFGAAFMGTGNSSNHWIISLLLRLYSEIK